MKTCPMPVGSPKYFEGNIWDKFDKPYGFFTVEVTTPEFLNIPVLQTKVIVKSSSGDCDMTIAPLGNWIDVFLSQ